MTLLMRDQQMREEGRLEGRLEGRKTERIRNLAEMLNRGGTEDQLRLFLDASDSEIAEAKIFSEEKFVP